MRKRIQLCVQPFALFRHKAASVTRMLHDGPGWINGVPIKAAFRFVLPVDIVVALTYFPIKNVFHRVPGDPFQAFGSPSIFWDRQRYQ